MFRLIGRVCGRIKDVFHSEYIRLWRTSCKGQVLLETGTGRWYDSDTGLFRFRDLALPRSLSFTNNLLRQVLSEAEGADQENRLAGSHTG